MKSGQKYKIYINDNPLVLADAREKIEPFPNDAIVVPYVDKTRQLLNFIDFQEKSATGRMVLIHSHDPKKLFNDFENLFVYIKASGGVVWNNDREVLLIYRRGKWDLPKGKKNKKETSKQAAVREVEEETGLTDIKLTRHLIKTFHTYRLPDRIRVLKRTSWYEMKVDLTQLTLQVEEEISDARWMRPGDFLDSELPTFNTIKDVLRAVASDYQP